ncbi:MAG: fimbrillin family protein, partial [Duncaniella sp.]|nr:fimbrillin family protein [Duncaniella sp.]
MTCVLSHSALRYLSIAALTATACAIVTGCSDDTPDLQPGDQGSEIRFKVTATGVASWHSRGGEQQPAPLPSVTLAGTDGTTLYLHPSVTETAVAARSTAVDSETIGSFGVFAAYNPSSLDITDLSPDYMYNVEVTRANDWTPVKNYLWPGSGKLHFTAYSPFAESASAGDGIISLPLRSDSGHLMLGFKVPADVADQTDLLVSTPKDASSSPCELDFNHALTAIRIATGDRMAPCKVTKIEITGVADSGTLDMETGSWTDVSGNASYAVSTDVELTAADGSENVAPDTPITAADQTFMLMPQTLGDDASLAITLEVGGSTTRLEGSLAGGVWEAGKTIVYNLSANPESDSLILDVDGSFSTTYLGGTMDFTVTSQYRSKGTLADVNWKAEFVDDNGNVIDRPQWIVDFPKSGTGVSESKVVTRIQDFTFDVISPESQILQDAADINATSGHTPYNLASSTGASAVENTANSYIINSPGIYSIPLVYGNAIKNGAANTSAYTATSQLRTFVNHTGNGITDPYIYNNSDCTPADAVLVWEDHLNLIRDVKLSDDSKSIILDIPHSSIRQGNALV